MPASPLRPLLPLPLLGVGALLGRPLRQPGHRRVAATRTRSLERGPAPGALLGHRVGGTPGEQAGRLPLAQVASQIAEQRHARCPCAVNGGGMLGDDDAAPVGAAAARAGDAVLRADGLPVALAGGHGDTAGAAALQAEAVAAGYPFHDSLGLLG